MTKNILRHPEDQPEGGWTEDDIGKIVEVEYQEIVIEDVIESIVMTHLLGDGKGKVLPYGSGATLIGPLTIIGTVYARQECAVRCIAMLIERQNDMEGME